MAAVIVANVVARLGGDLHQAELRSSEKCWEVDYLYNCLMMGFHGEIVIGIDGGFMGDWNWNSM